MVAWGVHTAASGSGQTAPCWWTLWALDGILDLMGIDTDTSIVKNSVPNSLEEGATAGAHGDEANGRGMTWEEVDAFLQKDTDRLKAMGMRDLEGKVGKALRDGLSAAEKHGFTPEIIIRKVERSLWSSNTTPAEFLAARRVITDNLNEILVAYRDLQDAYRDPPTPGPGNEYPFNDPEYFAHSVVEHYAEQYTEVVDLAASWALTAIEETGHRVAALVQRLVEEIQRRLARVAPTTKAADGGLPAPSTGLRDVSIVLTAPRPGPWAGASLAA